MCVPWEICVWVYLFFNKHIRDITRILPRAVCMCTCVYVYMCMCILSSVVCWSSHIGTNETIIRKVLGQLAHLIASDQEESTLSVDPPHRRAMLTHLFSYQVTKKVLQHGGLHWLSTPILNTILYGVYRVSLRSIKARYLSMDRQESIKDRVFPALVTVGLTWTTFFKSCTFTIPKLNSTHHNTE